MKWAHLVLNFIWKILACITRTEFILATFRTHFFKPTPLRRYRRLTQKTPALSKRRKPAWVVREIVRMKAQTPNAVWGLDLTGKGDAAGDIHAIVGLIDYGSRLALRLHPVRQRSSVVLLKVILAAVETFGLPRVIKTDNEACFTSRLFRFGLAVLGIRHQLSLPGQPWHNGRIERLFLTLKQKLNQLEVADFGGLEQALIVFRCWYNAVRPHQHLQGRTPLDAWRGVDPFKQAPKSVTLFEAREGLLTGYYMRR